MPFGLGGWELVVIAALVALIFGPSQLPKLGRSLGSSIREFRKVGKELTSAVEDEKEPRADD